MLPLYVQLTMSVIFNLIVASLRTLWLPSTSWFGIFQRCNLLILLKFQWPWLVCRDWTAYLQIDLPQSRLTNKTQLCITRSSFIQTDATKPPLATSRGTCWRSPFISAKFVFWVSYRAYTKSRKIMYYLCLFKL